VKRLQWCRIIELEQYQTIILLITFIYTQILGISIVIFHLDVLRVDKRLEGEDGPMTRNVISFQVDCKIL